MSKQITLTPEQSAWLSSTFDRNRSLYAGWRMEGEGEGGEGGEGGEPKGKEADSFTQADVDRIVAERLKREREATKTKYADYDDLKAKAAGAQTAEERIAAMEKEIRDAKVSALRAQYAVDVPEKLRPLLTGTTDEELKEQRDLLMDGEAERKKRGNRVPHEGKTPTKSGDDGMREFARDLFNRPD
jgi:hypothetical protein